MSGDDPWWPGSDNDDPTTWSEQPAFTTQRKLLEGVVEGGDYVRGSAVEELTQAALRYPTALDEKTTQLVSGKGVLWLRVFDYNTIEVHWNIPTEVLDTWAEMSLVRSGFGFPSTPNDGQTFYRRLKTDLWPNGYPMILNDVGEEVPLVETLPVFDPRDPAAAGGPPWNGTGLTSGRWYYYSLFFRIGNTWVRSMVSSMLLPRNHHHAEHLWNNVPPYYRWTDEQQPADPGSEGTLHKFLRIFGFELDHTREYIEQWQNLYNTDLCPGPLLRRLGGNFDIPYESGIGDIRYRSLLSKIGYHQRGRGTMPTLERVICSVVKTTCEMSPSANMLLVADNSDFFQSTGHWVVAYPDTPGYPSTPGYSPAGDLLATPLTPDPDVDVLHRRYVWLGTMTEPAQGLDDVLPRMKPPPGFGRGYMRVWTDAARSDENIMLTCGDGTVGSPDDVTKSPYTGTRTGVRSLIPRYAGIHVEPHNVYSFSIWAAAPAATTIDLMIGWFSINGNPDNITNFSARMGGTAVDGDYVWTQFYVAGVCPPTVEARESVPGSGDLDEIRATPDPDNGLTWTFHALQWSGSKEFTDSIGITDSLSVVSGSAAEFTDSIGIADTTTRSISGISHVGYDWTFTGLPNVNDTAVVTVTFPSAGDKVVTLTSPAGGPYEIVVPAIDAPTVSGTYAIPSIHITDRGITASADGYRSMPVFFGGAVFSLLGSDKAITTEGPDKYKRLGTVGALLGGPDETHEGYIIGAG